MNKSKKKLFSWLTDKRQVTCMSVPHDGKSVKQMVIPMWGIRWLTIFLIALMILSAGCYYHYRLIANKYDAAQIEVQQLREINAEQKIQIERLNVNVNQLKEKQKQLDETDNRVKQLIN